MKQLLKAPTRSHDSMEIVLKKAEVDKEVVPLLDWLNSFDGVVTWYSCEGSTKAEVKEGYQEYTSYALFSCQSTWSLMQILEKFTKFTHDHEAMCQVEFQPELNYPIRYNLIFKTKEVLKKFIDIIKL